MTLIPMRVARVRVEFEAHWWMVKRKTMRIAMKTHRALVRTRAMS
jgi:hypothetical protein